MKLFHYLISAILLVTMLSCANDSGDEQGPPRPSVDKLAEWIKTIPGVESVQELPSGTFKKHFMIFFKQQLDPKNPAAGTFSQRLFLSHQDFDNPVILHAEGYSMEDSKTKPESSELSNRYNANVLCVEHRFTGESIPSKVDWLLANSENAAADIHAVRVAFGAAYTGRWVATGISKGGTNTMTYMMFYPNDVDAGVSYVGPICDGQRDIRFVEHIRNVATKAERDKAVGFLRELLIRRVDIQPIFFPETTTPNNTKEQMTNDQSYESCIVGFIHNIWQWNVPTAEMPDADDSDEVLIEYAKRNKVFDDFPGYVYDEQTQLKQLSFSTIVRRLQGQMTRSTLTNDEISGMQYYVQAILELGSYASMVEPFVDLMPNYEEWDKDALARFVVPVEASHIKFSDKLMTQLNNWLQANDPRLLCIHGEYDHWTAAAPARSFFTGKGNMSIYIAPKGSHISRIKELNAADNARAWAKLDGWIKK